MAGGRAPARSNLEKKVHWWPNFEPGRPWGVYFEGRHWEIELHRTRGEPPQVRRRRFGGHHRGWQLAVDAPCLSVRQITSCSVVKVYSEKASVRPAEIVANIACLD